MSSDDIQIRWDELVDRAAAAGGRLAISVFPNRDFPPDSREMGSELQQLDTALDFAEGYITALEIMRRVPKR